MQRKRLYLFEYEIMCLFMDKRTKPAFISILSNTFLVLLKLVVGTIIGSIAIVAEALHSAMDLAAAVIAYYSIKKAGAPPDEKHEFGHGKIENISGVIEGLLIFLAAMWIIYEAVKAIKHGAHILELCLGIAVMGVSAVLNYVVSGYLFKSAQQFSSPALLADAWHLRTDVYTSIGVFAGLIIVKITHIKILDPILAIVVAVLILAVSIKLMRESMGDLVDEALPAEEVEKIKHTLNEHIGMIVEFHELRTRRAGRERHIDLHLVLKKTYTLEAAHNICTHLEKEIKQKFPGVKILIHIEPCKGKSKCDHNCMKCV